MKKINIVQIITNAYSYILLFHTINWFYDFYDDSQPADI